MPGARTSARSAKGIALACIVIAVVLFAAVSALATHVDPILVGPGPAGNPKCPEGQQEYVLQAADFTNGQHSDGTLTVTISNFNGQTSTFDWSSNIGVDSVFVKGGDYANVYNYDPESTGDTGLHTPLNQNNDQNYGLSHVTFCYDVEQSSPTPTPTTPTPTPSTPGPSVSPSETVTTSPSSSVLPTETSTTPASVLGEKLTKTGADVIRLALFALAIVFLGVGAYVASTRAARKSE